MVSMGRDDFVVNSQEDVPEVLNYLLDNFCGISVLSQDQDQIKVVIRNRITCTNCLQSDDREYIHMILKLNVAGNVNSAFNNYLNEEVILNRECPVCLSKHSASLEKRVVVAQGCQRTLKTLKTLKSLEIEKATLKTLKKVVIWPQTLKTVIRTLKKKCFPCLPQFGDYVSTCNRELGHLVS